jgi:hypothetical protein
MNLAVNIGETLLHRISGHCYNFYDNELVKLGLQQKNNLRERVFSVMLYYGLYCSIMIMILSLPSLINPFSIVSILVNFIMNKTMDGVLNIYIRNIIKMIAKILLNGVISWIIKIVTLQLYKKWIVHG